MKVSGAFLKELFGLRCRRIKQIHKTVIKNDLIATHIFPSPMLYIGITKMLGNVKNVAEQLYVAS